MPLIQKLRTHIVSEKGKKKITMAFFFSVEAYSYHKVTGLSPAGEKRRWIEIAQAAMQRRTMVGNAKVKARSCAVLCHTMPSRGGHFSAIGNLTTKQWWTAEEAERGASERCSCLKLSISIGNKC